MSAIDVWAGADLGRRENQEDWHAIEHLPGGDGVLVVVADGMGGQTAGEVASRTAGEAFVRSFLSNESAPVADRLMQATQEANVAIAQRIAADPELDGMGTTLLAAHLSGQSLSWVSVGDSCLLLLSAGELHRLNGDHSYGALLDKQAAEGKITAEEAAGDPDRNALISCLMGGDVDLVEVTEKPMVLETGNIIVAASDGIETLRPDEIRSVARRGPVTAELFGGALFDEIAKANRRFQDNTTIAVVRLEAGSAATSPLPAAGAI